MRRLSLERSIDNIAKRLDRFDPVFHSSSKIRMSYWKGKPIIPMEEWIGIRDTPYVDYFPDDFDQLLTFIPENKLKQEKEQEEVKKWDSNYLELMEYTKNPNYGKLKCSHCLLNPGGDDPIFIGISRLVSKGLAEQENDLPQYPCQVVNRFQCPYERTKIKEEENNSASATSHFCVDDLFRLKKMAFVIEIALAKARKEDSKIRIKNKEELLHALTDKDTFVNILDQGNEALEESEDLRKYARR